MQKLVYFLACEKMLVNEEAPVPSFISVFDQLNFPTPPPDAINPQVGLKWELVSFWRKIPEDDGKTFQQRTILVSPNGEETAPSIIEFVVPSTSHRNNVRIFGFPASPVGEYHAQLFIREAGTEDWVQVGDFPITTGYVE